MFTRRIKLVFFSTLCVAFFFQFANGASWKARITITLPSGATDLSFSPDGNLIAAGHSDGKVTVWDARSGELRQTLAAHTNSVRDLGFSPGGEKLVTLGRDNRGRIWSVTDWKEIASIEDFAFSFAVSPDGRWLVAQDAKQAIWLWDFQTLKRERQLSKPGIGGTNDLSFVDGGRVLAIYASGVHRIDVMTGEDTLVPIQTSKPDINLKQTGQDEFAISLGGLNDDNALMHNLAVSRGGSLLAIGRAWYGKPAFVDVFDLVHMKAAGRFKPKAGGTRASISFDNTMLAIEGATDVTIWKLNERKQFASVKGAGLVQFSPKSFELAVTDGNSLLIYIPEKEK